MVTFLQRKYPKTELTFRYGPPSMIYRLANYTLEGMLYLSMNEFTTPEREQKLGVMVRPLIYSFFPMLFARCLALAGMALWCPFAIRWSFSNQSFDCK